MSDKLKQKVLIKLLKVYRELDYAGNTSSDVGKSIMFRQLQSETKINAESLKSVLDSLYFEKYIDRLQLGTGHSDTVMWSITGKGKDALVNGKFAWHSYDKLVTVAPIVISIIALIVSVIALFN